MKSGRSILGRKENMGKGMWHEGMCQVRGPGGSLARWEQSSVIEVVGVKLER